MLLIQTNQQLLQFSLITEGKSSLTVRIIATKPPLFKFNIKNLSDLSSLFLSGPHGFIRIIETTRLTIPFELTVDEKKK